MTPKSGTGTNSPVVREANCLSALCFLVPPPQIKKTLGTSDNFFLKFILILLFFCFSFCLRRAFFIFWFFFLFLMLLGGIRPPQLPLPLFSLVLVLPFVPPTSSLILILILLFVVICLLKSLVQNKDPKTKH